VLWNDFVSLLDPILGLREDVQELTVGQMIVRAALVFLVTLAFVRLGPSRMVGRRTAFDFVMTLIIGSVLARAINGQAPLGTTIVASGALFAMHWLLAFGSFHWHWLGKLVKGEEIVLVRNGQMDRRGMQAATISERDLLEDVRNQLKQEDLRGVESARLERGGDISFIKRSEPKVLEVKVEPGVQTVRIELRD
jgi:uncharacterized membrane protein YcaP (DUF421 family)